MTGHTTDMWLLLLLVWPVVSVALAIVVGRAIARGQQVALAARAQASRTRVTQLVPREVHGVQPMHRAG